MSGEMKFEPLQTHPRANKDVDLGLGKHTASQILDAGRVQRALRSQHICPHCRQSMPTDPD